VAIEEMTAGLSEIETRVLAVLQEGFADSRRPYKQMAEKAGMDTAQFLEILKDFKRSGRLRRIGAIVSHIKMGLAGAAMVAWQVEPQRIEQVGTFLAGFEQVSHAYERQTAQNWPYNIYTMVHGKDISHLEDTINQMSRAAGVTTYKILTTEKELKKAPPRYIARNR
jgi:DNA-binding Lrp family transcriptional regulator